MDTSQLQNTLRALDNRTQQVGCQLTETEAQAHQLFAQASNFRITAESILDRAGHAESAEQSADMVSQASAYLSRAQSCEDSARQLTEQVPAMRATLRACQGEYQKYQKEGLEKLASLGQTVGKLAALAGGKYGWAQFGQALEQAKGKTDFYQKLVSGCEKRIRWIGNICG